MKKILLALFLTSLWPGASGFEPGEVRYEQEDVDNFQEVMNFIGSDSALPASQLVIKIARHLLGTPYASSSIESEPEILTVNTRQTDCILFVEMCVAMSLTAKQERPTFDKYVECLRNFRYRNGVVDGYSSRLHYTSEWIAQGEERGVFREVTSEIGGIPLKQRFTFMTDHSDQYAQLRDNPGLQILILNAEEDLERAKYWYIPKAVIPEHLSQIKDGDIICFTSATSGLDIAHVAFALWQEGSLTFIHASSAEGKVVICSKTLTEYTDTKKNHSGIRVVRLRNQ